MPLNFGNLFPPQPVFVNYDWIDIADGVGYVTYYAGANYVQPDFTYIISSKPFYSGIIHTGEVKMVLTTWTLMVDVDWDLTFNVPKNVEGDIIFTVPFSGTHSGSDTTLMRCLVGAYHYDGSTETLLGSGTTEEISILSAETHISTVKVNVPRTHFKSGESLRFSVMLYHKRDTSNVSGMGGLGHDPMNRSDKTYSFAGSDDQEQQYLTTDKPTQMTFQVPFKLDI